MKKSGFKPFTMNFVAAMVAVACLACNQASADANSIVKNLTNLRSVATTVKFVPPAIELFNEQGVISGYIGVGNSSGGFVQLLNGPPSIPGGGAAFTRSLSAIESQGLLVWIFTNGDPRPSSRICLIVGENGEGATELQRMVQCWQGENPIPHEINDQRNWLLPPYQP